MMNNVSFIIPWKDSSIILLSFAKILFLKNSLNFNFLLENFFALQFMCFQPLFENHRPQGPNGCKPWANRHLKTFIFEKGYLMINMSWVFNEKVS